MVTAGKPLDDRQLYRKTTRFIPVPKGPDENVRTRSFRLLFAVPFLSSIRFVGGPGAGNVPA
jgi:hypothetical protein